MSTGRQPSLSSPGQGHSDRKASISAQDMPHLAPVSTNVTENAARATSAERSMTLTEGFRLYPKAIAWSILLSTCIVMEGYDIVLINSLYGLPAFQRRFGTRLADGSYEISAQWQSGLSNGALVGEILGLFLVGDVAERFGYKKTIIGALVAVTGFIFLQFFAQNLPMLLIGEILCGIPWGAFQTLTTTYAAEVCPVALRAYLTTYVNLCWIIGQLICSGVLRGLSGKTGAIGYKLPYGLQWMWPLPLIAAITFAPESPWWLVRKGRKDDAKAQMLRLTSRNQDSFDVHETVDMMIYTTELERANSEGASYWDCFRHGNARRTEITCGVWAIQILCGSSALTGYSIYFLERAGLDTSAAVSLSLGEYALGAVGTILSWFLMGSLGRRTLYLWGQIGMIIVLLAIGFLAIAPSHDRRAQWGIGGMIIVYTFVYDATIGPVCYSLVAELPSTRLRNKTAVLARNLYNITGVVANIITPYMLNPTSWGWGAKAGFFWAGICTLCAIWTFFRLPEPKGRTYAELDMLFEAKVPARRFKATMVESFSARAEGTASLGMENPEKDQVLHITRSVNSTLS